LYPFFVFFFFFLEGVCCERTKAKDQRGL
jgi:hypothetical protein